MKRSHLIVAVLFGSAVAFFLWASSPIILRAAARWLDVGERPRKADYVMVLVGDERTRPFVAAELVKEGWARSVIIAASAASPQSVDGVLPLSSEIVRKILISRGVPPERIVFLPVDAATTHDEAWALTDFLEDRPNARVLVVTSDYHSRRSRWIFLRTLAGRTDDVAFVSAPTDYFDFDSWWRDQWGTRAVASEYLKLAFYLMRYGHLLHWAAACLLLAVVAAWIRRRQTIAE